MLISLPIVGLFVFFFKKKKEAELSENVSLFVLAFILYVSLLLLASSEVFLMAVVPYFAEKTLFIFFLALKILLMAAHGYLMILESSKNCQTFCRAKVYPFFPALQSFEFWVKDLVGD